MSKHEKQMGVQSPSTQRRIDAPAPGHKKGKRTRKEFPQHWEVRAYGHNTRTNTFHVSILPHKHTLKGFGYGMFPREIPPGLTERLAYLATLYPETASWPVRFVSGAAIECSREVIR